MKVIRWLALWADCNNFDIVSCINWYYTYYDQLIYPFICRITLSILKTGFHIWLRSSFTLSAAHEIQYATEIGKNIVSFFIHDIFIVSSIPPQSPSVQLFWTTCAPQPPSVQLFNNRAFWTWAAYSPQAPKTVCINIWWCNFYLSPKYLAYV